MSQMKGASARNIINTDCHYRSGDFMSWKELQPVGRLLTYFTEIWLHSFFFCLSEFYIHFIEKESERSRGKKS